MSKEYYTKDDTAIDDIQVKNINSKHDPKVVIKVCGHIRLVGGYVIMDTVVAFCPANSCEKMANTTKLAQEQVIDNLLSKANKENNNE